jgi:hypothetical protein
MVRDTLNVSRSPHRETGSTEFGGIDHAAVDGIKRETWHEGKTDLDGSSPPVICRADLLILAHMFENSSRTTAGAVVIGLQISGLTWLRQDNSMQVYH